MYGLEKEQGFVYVGMLYILKVGVFIKCKDVVSI